ncbi:MAG: ATP-binding cassette domain-containing protein [Hyphomicrobium sp.]
MTGYHSVSFSGLKDGSYPDHKVPNQHEFSQSTLLSARKIKLVIQDRIILEEIDLDIHEGEIVTLIGPNGSGKTSLVRVLLGIQNLTSGVIHRRQALKVGYVPQHFQIDRSLPLSVERFLCLGRKYDPKNIHHILNEVGAHRCLNQQMIHLSGGEIQRVLLARALISQPELLVLDEPARGLDYTGEAEFYALIENLRSLRKLGILLVSHDLHIVMGSSDHVLCLNRHICCSGKPDAVSQHPEYTKMFGLKAGNAFGVYHHNHDHIHGLNGAECPLNTKNNTK